MLKPIQLLLLIAALAGCDRPDEAPGQGNGTAQIPTGTNEAAGRQAGAGNGGEPDNRNRVALTTTPPPVCVSLHAVATEGRADDAHRLECLHRLAELLAMPRLRPVVKPDSDTIIGGATDADLIIQAYFAQEAGVALLRTTLEQRVIDLATGEALYREPYNENFLGSMSANGRVYVTGSKEIARIRDTVTGETLIELDASPWQVQIPDANTLIYTLPDGSRSTLLDLDTGTQIPLTIFENPVYSAIPSRDRNNAYTLLGSSMAALVTVNRTATPPYVHLIDARKSTVGFASAFPDTLSTDGRYILSRSGGVTIIDLHQLQSEATVIKELVIDALLPTTIPDQVLVVGKNYKRDERMYFLFSLASRRLTPIDLAGYAHRTIVYVAPLKRLAALDGNSLHLFDLEFSGDVESGAEDAGTLSRELQESNAQGRKHPLAEKLKPLAREAEVWMVGVGHGTPDASRPHTASHEQGTVRVTLLGSREDPPVVLVLSSYDPVRWIISNEGPELRAVLLAAYYPATLEGTADVPVFDFGRTPVRDNKGHDYTQFSDKIEAATGKSISLFKGADQGDRMIIGPTRSR